MNTWQKLTRAHHFAAFGERLFIRFADMKGEAITQGWREAFIIFAFIQREQREARVHMRMHPFALDMKSARVERSAKMGNRIGRQSLGHSGDNHAAMAFRQEATHGDRLSGGKCRTQIKPAEQPIF